MTELRRFAVFGDPIEHSRSPDMHAAAFAALGLPHRYERRHVRPDELSAALAEAWDEGLWGLNLTVPHKVAALADLDRVVERTEAVRRIGATNTLLRGPGGWIADNTDGVGFVRALAQLGEAAPGRALVFGSGGASLAVVDGLREAFPALELLQVSRSVPGEPEVEHLRCTYDDLDETLEIFSSSPGEGVDDLWVNCTTVGMANGPSEFPRPLPLDRLGPASRVVDIVYPRPDGGLLDRAETHGARVQDGREMLLWQGVVALERWLGIERLGDEVVTAMRAALG